jgi:hypothetical protein
MRSQARRLRLVALSVTMSLAACSDSTAPGDGALQVIVTPDVIPTTGINAGIAYVTLRNTGRTALEIDECNISLETETGPGVWSDPNPSVGRCIAMQLAAEAEQKGFRVVGTAPGHRRFVYRYWLATWVGDPGGAHQLVAYSNSFVVGP